MQENTYRVARVNTLTTRQNHLVGSQGMKVVCVRNGFGKKAAIWLSRG
jgi:hypothetical protein